MRRSYSIIGLITWAVHMIGADCIATQTRPTPQQIAAPRNQPQHLFARERECTRKQTNFLKKNR